MHHIRIWSSGTGNVLQAFHLQSFCILSFYKKTFRFTPAICKDCTVPRIRSGFLPTCEAQQGFTPTRKWRRHFCRQRTTFAAFTLSLQKGASFCNLPLVIFCILNFYKKIFRFTPAICQDCTDPRIQHGFLLTRSP